MQFSSTSLNEVSLDSQSYLAIDLNIERDKLKLYSNEISVHPSFRLHVIISDPNFLKYYTKEFLSSFNIIFTDIQSDE